MQQLVSDVQTILNNAIEQVSLDDACSIHGLLKRVDDGHAYILEIVHVHQFMWRVGQ